MNLGKKERKKERKKQRKNISSYLELISEGNKVFNYLAMQICSCFIDTLCVDTEPITLLQHNLDI
jgi:hypothetical protein